MDLFVINRYWGENGHEPKELEPNLKMNQLLQRIEERKKKKNAISVETVKSENNDTEDEPIDRPLVSKKHKKKKRSRDSISTEISHDKIIKLERNEALNTDQNSNYALSSGIDANQSVNDSLDADVTLKSGTVGPAEKFSSEIIDDISSANGDWKDNVGEKTVNTEGFTVIGTESFASRRKASHKLPCWLENPVHIPVDLGSIKSTMEDYKHLLDPRLIQKLKENGISHFFPVQEKVIPWLLQSNLRCLYHWPRDVCVSAPTGSGKTLAYVLPTIQAILNRLVPDIRVLVVLPVVELAKQVGSVYRQYCAGTGLKVTVAVGGGTSFSAEHNLLINKGELIGCQTDIFVTTPGRLVAHLRGDSGDYSTLKSSMSGKISFSKLRFLVVDEADRVAEGSQNDWLSHLLNHLENNGRSLVGLLPPSVNSFRKASIESRRPPQKLLFSATLSRDPEKLAALSLFHPKLFSTVSSKKEEHDDDGANRPMVNYITPEELSEKYAVAEGGEGKKPLVLLWILQQRLQSSTRVPKILIFTGSRKSSKRLSLLLSLVPWNVSDSTINSCHLSADLSAQDREMILRDFVEGRTHILVCSDALARGVDIPLVDVVISYDPPRFAKNHIHRIGRTGRAGHPGCAITLLTPKQVSSFAVIVSGGSSMGSAEKIEIDADSLSSLNENFETALASMEKIVQEENEYTKTKKKRKRRSGKVRKSNVLRKENGVNEEVKNKTS